MAGQAAFLVASSYRGSVLEHKIPCGEGSVSPDRDGATGLLPPRKQKAPGCLSHSETRVVCSVVAWFLRALSTVIYQESTLACSFPQASRSGFWTPL